jgi:ABC-type Fe3+/spermidine/putrescine transport system ATPase subunit
MPIGPVAPLEIAGLHVSYGGVPALRGVDLAVGAGEFVALLGPSGCGKTSLLRAVAGFIQPAGGVIRLGGRDVATLPARKRNIGVVFQSYALFPHMDAAANVAFGLQCRGIRGAAASRKVADALALVGMAGLASRRPAELSGGQQQRIALARAIVIEPDLLLLDEPLGALDRQLRGQMQAELTVLQRRLGIAALFVTHDQAEAMAMADRIAVMRDGVIVQVDTPERLFAHPANAWVCEFIGAGNLLRGAMSRTATGTWRMQLAPGVAFDAAGSGPGAMFIPTDQVRLHPAPDGTGLPVSARRFLGGAMEVQVATPAGTVATVLPLSAAAAFLPGQAVLISAAADACRLLSDT